MSVFESGIKLWEENQRYCNIADDILKALVEKDLTAVHRNVREEFQNAQLNFDTPLADSLTKHTEGLLCYNHALVLFRKRNGTPVLEHDENFSHRHWRFATSICSRNGFRFRFTIRSCRTADSAVGLYKRKTLCLNGRKHCRIRIGKRV